MAYTTETIILGMKKMFEKVDETIAPEPTYSGGFDDTVDFQDQSVRFKFKHLKDRSPGESWIQMVYGASKTGKTFYAGTTGARTLFLNIGDGLDTLMSPAFTQKYPLSKEMIVVDIRENDPKNMTDAFDMVTDVINHAIKHFPNKFDNVVMDEATALRKYALNKATELNTAARTKGTPRDNRLQDYMKAEIGDYGVEMDMIEWFLGQYIPKFKEANKHFLMLAHERQIFAKPDKQGDDAVLKRVLPGFTGKTFPDKVPAFFDDVFRSEIVTDAAGNAMYVMRTAGNSKEMAGVRHGGIFETVEKNPDYQKLLKRIQLAQPKSKR